MKYYGKLFCLELKRFARVIPYTLIGAVVLLTLIGTIAFCASNLLYQTQEIDRKEVAVVTSEQENAYIGFAMDMLENLDSTSLALSFSFYDEEEAYEALDDGSIIAILLFPDNVINGILYGDNYPITVVFPTGSDLSSVFLTELSKAAGDMLSCAQASISVSTDLYYIFNMQNSLGEAYDKINLINISHVLQREELFVTESIGLSGAGSTLDYYIASAMLLFLLIFGAAFAPVMQKESYAFLSLQRSKHTSLLGYLLSRFLSCAILFFVWLLLFFGIFHILVEQVELIEHFALQIKTETILLLLLFALLLSAYTNFIYFSAKDASSAILTFFLLGSGLLLLSGGIIPSIFFPSFLRTLGSYLPTAYLHENILLLLYGGNEFSVLPLFGYLLLFFLLSLLFLFLGSEEKRPMTTGGK